MPAPPPMNSSRRGDWSRSVNTPYGPVTSSSSPTLILAVRQQARELPVGIQLDHELQLVRLVGRVRHRERAVLAVRARDRDVDVLARLELQPLRLEQLEHEPADVVRELLDRLDLGSPSAIGTPAAQDLLVVVDQLDLEVGHRVRPAQQRVPLLPPRSRAARTSSSGRGRPRRRAGTTCTPSTAPPCSRASASAPAGRRRSGPSRPRRPRSRCPRARTGRCTSHPWCVRRPGGTGPSVAGASRRELQAVASGAGRRGRPPCTWRCRSRAPRATSRSGARSGSGA